ncbi:unnamed protein product [Didymodactylos carnosus]|uniref:Uncharacterized protein n=1 Tax=Didymodactylos carnosus TaxID=1234261 RepID=A0A815LH10_9BILA|nr:unnamed protein product [Didymodactylos carnosus]CAF4297286.1 unnamed protein product [Didymodactylos carnosus]
MLLFETVNLNEIKQQRYDHERSENKRSVDKLAETETTPNGLADEFNQTLSDPLDLPVKRPKSNANEEQASDKEDIDDDDDNIQMTYSKVATTC